MACERGRCCDRMRRCAWFVAVTMPSGSRTRPDTRGGQHDGRQAQAPDRHQQAAPGADLRLLLGGKDNYPVDGGGRADPVHRPDAKHVARSNRGSCTGPRLAGREAGIRQFLDIGTGIPTEPNLHQIAQTAAPEPGSSTPTTTPSCSPTPRRCCQHPRRRTDYIQADVREPGRRSSTSAETLDFEQARRTVAHRADALHPRRRRPVRPIAAHISARCPAAVVWCSPTSPRIPLGGAEQDRRLTGRAASTSGPPAPPEVERFFEGLDFVGPGLVTRWYDEEPAGTGKTPTGYAGIAYLP